MAKKKKRQKPEQAEPENKSIVLKRVHDLSEFIEPEPIRYSSISHILYDPATKQLVATDARCMAVVPVPNGGDCRMLIPPDVLSDALEYARQKRDKEIRVSKNPDGKTLNVESKDICIRCDDGEGRFPKFETLWVEPEQPFAFHLSAQLVKRICEHAIRSADGHDAGLKIVVDPSDPDHPTKFIGFDRETRRSFATYILAVLHQEEPIPDGDR